MAYLLNDPANFVEEMTEGFISAHSDLVRAAHGGVLRREATQKGHVAVVIGGGSGHYPAFAGLVGPGLAHGAAMGNVFASPSAQQVLGVAKASEVGGGVLFTYGNYAGDVMNFNQAQERLNSAGIPCKTVLVTDDIMSATKEEIDKRRGIAGDLFVFKIAGAAADAGYSLDDVERVATLANQYTRTIGVAFSGCTLPGKSAPLFKVPATKMALGLGIHGEPGLEEVEIPTADDLAKSLVERLLEETPDGLTSKTGTRLVVLLNGLGGVKYEELFVVYRAVKKILDAWGVVIVEPEVGELVTSFEMAGASLTFCWLDEELESLWHLPAYTPAYRKGSVVLSSSVTETREEEIQSSKIAVGSEDSRLCALGVLSALETIKITVDKNESLFGQLDSFAGDGDHGIGMARGANAAFTAAKFAVESGAGCRTTLEFAADAWSDRAGGTSGALWGIILNEIGKSLGDDRPVDGQLVAKGVSSALEGVMNFGKAQLGDKTLVDAFHPFSQNLSAEIARGSGLDLAWNRAAETSKMAADKTADLLPKLGRARPHAEKSIGHPDPGAVSLSVIALAIGEILKGVTK